MCYRQKAIFTHDTGQKPSDKVLPNFAEKSHFTEGNYLRHSPLLEYQVVLLHIKLMAATVQGRPQFTKLPSENQWLFCMLNRMLV